MDCKLTAKVETLELAARVKPLEGLTAHVDFDVPRLPDYFRWRQERFDPYFHLPLNDPPGSTVAKALAGPDGVHEGVVYPGAEGIIRPYGRYSATRYEEGGGRTVIPDEGRFDFIPSTQVYTFSYWVHADTEVHRLIENSAGASTTAGFMTGVRTQRVSWAYKNGERYTSLDFREWPLVIGGTIHITATADGDRIRLYVNGIQVNEADTQTPRSDIRSRVLINGTSNSNCRLSGLLIDTRPWTPEEVQEDYLRGMGVWDD